jgi:uncharacterized RmlC-like cupin family protein
VPADEPNDPTGGRVHRVGPVHHESELSEAIDAAVAGNDAWHRPLHHIRGGDLTADTTQTSGMRRYEAISGKTVGSEKLWMGRTHVGPVTNSGDHHHGEAETAIYVVSGHPVFVFAERSVEGRPSGGEREGARVERRIQTAPGDYVFVPPWVPHREENPSADEEAVVVIARSTQEGIVVNVPSLWAPVEIPETES